MEVQAAAIISLVALIAAIVIGVVKKNNVGIISVLFAFIVGFYFVGMSQKNIYVKGWPTQVFFSSIAVMLLFGVAKANGTLNYLVKALVSLTRGNDRLLPIVMFVGSALICATGAGIPFCSALLPIAFAIAFERNINPLLMCLITSFGIQAGGLSPLAIHGQTASALMSEAGSDNYIGVWFSAIAIYTIMAVLIYFILKGYKIPKSSAVQNADTSKAEKMDAKQIFTMVVILVVALTAILFGYDIGLVAFAGGALLLFFDCADEKKVVSSLPWNTMLLLGGTSILVNVMSEAGGITLLADILSNAITAKTAGSIMCILGGLLSFVSSAVGVVMPTLMPTAAEISANLGIPVVNLCAGIVLGSVIVGISPLSTIGGIGMASIPEDAEIDRNKFFLHMMFAAIGFTLLAALIIASGVLNVFLA